MRKALFGLTALLLAAPAFATYFVVLRNGDQIRAAEKPTVVGGKATIRMENGQTLTIDANSIDVAKSEEVTKLGGGSVLGVEQTGTGQPQQQRSGIGSAIKLRQLPGATQTAPATTTAPTPAPAIVGPKLSDEVVGKFERAYENVGIFEHKLTATGPHSLRAELTADSEEKVFNAISATSFLMSRNAGVPGTTIDMVELFMKTTTGGSAGRFQMNRADAQALDGKAITREEYFVRRVLY